MSGGAEAGTTGQDRPLEGTRVSLAGNVPPGLHVWYQVNVQDLGWKDRVSDGQTAWSPGESCRIEAICIRMEPDLWNGKELDHGLS